MREELVLLIELQKSDSAMSRIHVKKKELPERLAKLEEEFRAVQSLVDETKNRLDALQKDRAEKEGRLKKDGDALRKAKDRLNDVKTNKEYQAVLKEIETMESMSGRIEDEVISLLEDIDRIKAECQEQETGLQAHCGRFEEEKTQIEGEIASLDAELADIQAQNQELRKKVPPEMLKKYEMIKHLHRGVAVVSVWKEICGGCHMNIPPQQYNEMQRNMEIIHCPNCSRFLYRQDPGEK